MDVGEILYWAYRGLQYAKRDAKLYGSAYDEQISEITDLMQLYKERKAEKSNDYT